VNIPHFMLHALPRQEGEEAIEMRVVVGQTSPNMRTPIFTAQMQYVVFQPYWDVPRSIVLREQLPRIRKDPAYLERNQMELVRGQGDNSPVVPATPEAIEELATGKLRLRQRPGPHNSLGPVKFMLPNPYNVYLHATPATALFNRSRRAFSHGCVRVSDPVRLAEYVLKNAREHWDVARIEEAMCGSKTFRVDLVQPLTVMMFYGTAAATETQGVLFAEDLYGHDKRLEEQLAVDS
jgi:murein L,D-transpeptidase YcbB/YkuD